MSSYAHREPAFSQRQKGPTQATIGTPTNTFSHRMSDTLASVIGSPELGGGHSRIFDHWNSNRLDDDLSISRIHAMFWGKSFEDEQHVAQGSTPDADGDEVQGKDESMCVDGDSGTDGDEH